MRILLLPSSPRDSEHRDGRKEERKCCSLCSPYAHSPAPLVSERFRTSRRPQRKNEVFFLVFSLCAFSCSPRLREIPNIETAAKRKEVLFLVLSLCAFSCSARLRKIPN